MKYSVLYLEDGTLVGVTNAEPLALPGVSIKQLDVAPDLSTHEWDIDSLEFVRSTTQISKRELLSRFTLEERTSIRNSTDPIVQDLMFILDAANFIDLSDRQLIQGLNYLSSIGMLSPDRLDVILKGM